VFLPKQRDAEVVMRAEVMLHLQVGSEVNGPADVTSTNLGHPGTHTHADPDEGDHRSMKHSSVARMA